MTCAKSTKAQPTFTPKATVTPPRKWQWSAAKPRRKQTHDLSSYGGRARMNVPRAAQLPDGYI